MDPRIGNPFSKVGHLVDLADRIHQKILGRNLHYLDGLFLELLIDEQKGTFTTEDDRVKDVAQLLSDALPQVVRLEQALVHQRTPDLHGRGLAEGILHLFTTEVSQSNNYFPQAVCWILGACRLDLPILEIDRPLPGEGMDPQPAAPAGLVQKCNQIRDRERGWWERERTDPPCPTAPAWPARPPQPTDPGHRR